MARYAAGFRLLELLVVVALTLIIASVGGGHWWAWYEQIAAERYMQSLQHFLQTSRAHAVATQTTLRLCPSAQRTCQGNWGHDPTAAFSLNSAGQINVLWQSLPVMAMAQHSLSYNRPALEFRGDGGLNGLQNGTFVYCPQHDEWHLVIIVSQAGRSQYQFKPQPCPRR